MKRIAVVGASLAGLRAVETLRRKAFDGEIVWLGEESPRPYDRPPLSKEILRGDWEVDRLGLRRKSYDELEVDLRTGVHVDALDLKAHRLRLAGGDQVEFDALIIATGAHARRLPNQPDLEGVHVLRTLDDALAIRAALEAEPRVLVVGAGFIGAEVAASCRARGLEVTVIEPLEVPLMRGLGREMGQVCADLHRDNGVDLRCGISVERIEGGGKVERVRLSDGTSVDTDLVVIGVGAIPTTDWLEGSGLELDNGVVCDPYCATKDPDIFAAGDVARWYNPLFEEEMRVEHWTNAVEQGVYAACRILGDADAAEPFAPVPLFWSDQYDVKIQFAGRMRPDDEMRIFHGSVEERRFVALFGRKDRLMGALAFSRPRQLIGYKRMISERVSFEAACAQAAVSS